MWEEDVSLVRSPNKLLFINCQFHVVKYFWSYLIFYVYCLPIIHTAEQWTRSRYKSPLPYFEDWWDQCVGTLSQSGCERHQSCFSPAKNNRFNFCKDSTKNRKLNCFLNVRLAVFPSLVWAGGSFFFCFCFLSLLIEII